MDMKAYRAAVAEHDRQRAELREKERSEAKPEAVIAPVPMAVIAPVPMAVIAVEDVPIDPSPDSLAAPAEPCSCGLQHPVRLRDRSKRQQTEHMSALQAARRAAARRLGDL